ncbi:hypothetical protein EAE99_005486 [Botrytis elliptica]|nr:hypothetical protein EAE99_005486 [Botrytis elliptica]
MGDKKQQRNNGAIHQIKRERREFLNALLYGTPIAISNEITRGFAKIHFEVSRGRSIFFYSHK